MWSYDKQKLLVCDWDGCGQVFVLRKLLGNFEFSFFVDKILLQFEKSLFSFYF
jgi:hypothetical protein